MGYARESIQENLTALLMRVMSVLSSKPPPTSEHLKFCTTLLDVGILSGFFRVRMS